MTSGPLQLIHTDPRFYKLNKTNELVERLHAQKDIYNHTRDPKSYPNYDDISSSHVMFVKSSYIPSVKVVSEYMKIQPQGHTPSSLKRNSGETIKFLLSNTTGHFVSDCALHIKFKEVSPSNGDNLVRYCAYPGMRLIKEAKFTSDTELDKYTRDDVIFMHHNEIREDLKPAWNRSLGQENPVNYLAFSDQGHNYSQYANGPQTPKSTQGELDLWIPLQFFFSKKVNQSLVCSNSTNTQRTLEFTLDSLKHILMETGADGTSEAETQTIDEVQILNCELYANYLFTNPEIHQVFEANDKTRDLRLVQLHQSFAQTLNKQSDDISLASAFKYPIAWLYAGFRYRNNGPNVVSLDNFDSWFLFGSPKDDIDVPVVNEAGNVVTAKAKAVEEFDPIVGKVGVNAENITIAPLLPPTFYSTTPLLVDPTFGGNARLNSTKNSNLIVFPMQIYPNYNNPSGAFDSSAIRTLKFEYQDLIPNASSNNIELVMSARVYNFVHRNGDLLSLTMVT